MDSRFLRPKSQGDERRFLELAIRIILLASTAATLPSALSEKEVQLLRAREVFRNAEEKILTASVSKIDAA